MRKDYGKGSRCKRSFFRSLSGRHPLPASQLDLRMYLTAALTGIAQFRDFSLNIPWEPGPRTARAAALSHHARPPPRGPGFNPHTSPQGTAFQDSCSTCPAQHAHLCWDYPMPRLPAPGLTPPMASASPVFAHPSPFRRQSSTHILLPPVQDSRACQGLETPVT